MIHGNLFLRKMKKLKNNLFITIGENGIARIWDFTSGENLQNIFLNEKIFSFLSFKNFFFFGLKNKIRIFDKDKWCFFEEVDVDGYIYKIKRFEDVIVFGEGNKVFQLFLN